MMTESREPSSTNSPVGEIDENEQTQCTAWLIAISEHRDKEAFKQVFLHFSPKIQRVAEQKLGCPSKAMEVVQETMSNVWRKSHLYSASKGAASTWIYTIMRNVIFDALRKLKRNQELPLSEDIWPVENQHDIDRNDFQDHLQNRQMQQLVNALPTKQKEVITSLYFHEMTQQQLSQHLNVPIGTIKSRLRLALAKLQQQIGGEND
jgi:RNA polymerase sigma-70 factor (ECF subfamily)